MTYRTAWRTACCLAALAATTATAAPQKAAVFPFALDATGPQDTAVDVPRLRMMDTQVPGLLARYGQYDAIGIAPVQAEAAAQNLRACGGCDVAMAQKLGAEISVIGWVQKVSALILNINLVVRAVPGGQVLHAASVDIRGDTDESWQRGLSYLVKNELFKPHG
jgi:hypothetical protein